MLINCPDDDGIMPIFTAADNGNIAVNLYFTLFSIKAVVLHVHNFLAFQSLLFTGI